MSKAHPEACPPAKEELLIEHQLVLRLDHASLFVVNKFIPTLLKATQGRVGMLVVVTPSCLRSWARSDSDASATLPNELADG